MLRMLLLSMLPHHPIWFLVYTSLSPFGNEHSFTLLLYHRSGEKAIASKIEIGSKVIIIAMSIPIISSLLELIVEILP